MPGEEVCQVCKEPHHEARPLDLRFELAVPAQVTFTGPEEVLRQDYVQDQVLDRYEQDLEAVAGTCLSCRMQGRRFNHGPYSYSRRFSWIQAKDEAYQARKSEGKE